MMNGKLLAQMFISGANNLYNNRAAVDELNVFPVPDGDTGSNMSMTASAMAKALSEVQSDSVTKVADVMSFATLRGARGNSGVILSQFFRGISKSLKGKTECEPHDLALALKIGSDTAYNAVMNPTEGTILTVARDAADAAVSTEGDILSIIENAAQKGYETLKKTPEMLPALKTAGVVDAGGQGWLYVLDGMLYFLKNNEIIVKNISESGAKNQEEHSVKAQSKLKTDNIKYMYCTEFIVEKKDRSVNVLAFKQSLEKIGDSMLVIDDDDIVKVHIHTNNPGIVLEKAVKLGTMINIKIDNMKHQHQSLIQSAPEKAEMPHKKFGFVAVCAGDGISEIFKDLGIDNIIEGGQTMNPSTEDILAACEKINADMVFVFPNNKNIILAANQAREISKKNITVIPTKSIPACVAAMLAYNEAKDAENNEKAMNKAISNVKSGQITFAVRDTEVDGQKISKDDILGIAEGKIKSVGKSVSDVLCGVVDEMYDEDSEFITLYYGSGVTEEDAQKAGKILEEKYEDTEVSVKYGGQPLYYYLVSVE
ncbi:MAG: DAK2 domain-containing protein [Firmicutes bacterium]|nr:DAK2 domain-containing protein [Bacillota bacterium]